MALRIEPLTPERLPDLVDLFNRPGLSVARVLSLVPLTSAS